MGPAIIAACLLVAVTFALFRGRTLLARVGMLRVDRVVVHGNERLSKGEVMGMLDGLRGQSLFWTDLDVWRQRLLASPWVSDAALRRSLPSTVDVAISERTPVGVSRVGEAMYLVDERGILIDQYGPQYADLDLPIIDGLAMPSSDGSAADPARAELASRIITSIRTKPDLAHKLSQIDVTDLHNASVILSGDAAVIYIGDDSVRCSANCSRQGRPGANRCASADVPSIDYVADLRFDDRIYDCG